MFARLLTCLLSLLTVTAEEIYFTDFDNHPVGNNEWVGYDDWLGTEDTNGVNFIDDNAFNGSLGNSAGLGLERPNNRRVSVLKILNHDHVETGEGVIEIETLISIKDSDNDFRDDFYFSIFNSTGGNPIASIRFDNEDPEATNTRFGIWREDGQNQFDTQVNFIHEELYDLFICIDLNANTWSADLSGLPLFSNETFTSSVSGSDINLGIVGYEWQLSSPLTLSYGNNFLLVGDLRVTSVNNDVTPVDLLLSINENAEPVLEWEGKGGFTYQVEYCDDLLNWKDDLPNSVLTPGLSSGSIIFTDVTSPPLTKRFYRVITKAP
ncbi:MAG: hypothetical protein ABF328_08645 [Akkermansiaceae bacterium]